MPRAVPACPPAGTGSQEEGGSAAGSWVHSSLLGLEYQMHTLLNYLMKSLQHTSDPLKRPFQWEKGVRTETGASTLCQGPSCLREACECPKADCAFPALNGLPRQILTQAQGRLWGRSSPGQDGGLQLSVATYMPMQET